jgi:preprotein translocase subunit SecA
MENEPMFKALVTKIVGTRHSREMRRLEPVADRVDALESRMKALSDAELQAQTAAFRERYGRGESLDALLPEAFAVCREASHRALGMRHYRVQLIGGMILHEGTVAEMRTGEGKTLTATLALYLNAITGKGAHLVTVNDYLARRDAEWMGRLYSFLGMTTGIIVPDMSNAERKAAYACDITYGTNSEFGFDYLRDNMKMELEECVQRALHFAIVDEVDSILIDESRTPLIISGQAELNTELYVRVNAVVADLKRDQDYLVDEEHRSVTLTDEGTDRVQERLGIENLYDPEHIQLLHHVNKSLEAHTLFRRDERYMVLDGKIVIVDEFTGRQMPGRRWSDGLHQAIEAKEGVRILPESVTMATITYQNFFRMYDKLSGMTGTADTEAEEFQKIYKLDVTVVPTNRPIARLDHGDVVYLTEREKFAAIVDQIIACHEKGQPVLVGTTSVDKSEVISKVLKRRNIPHEVLNAKQHAREADIVAQAGRKGAVTIATNMAGRGTDILLGGNPENMAKQETGADSGDGFDAALERFRTQCRAERDEVITAGGLFILGTERHESRRIDNQLRGRAGRQGDPGESRFFLSLEDELMRRFGADKITGLMTRLGMQEGEPIEHGMVTGAIENAQKRVEGRNFDIRKSLLEYDDVMDVQRKAIYELRRRILAGENLGELMLDALDEAAQNLLNRYCSSEIRIEDWDVEALAREIHAAFGFEWDEPLPRHRATLEKMVWSRMMARKKEVVASMGPLLESRRAFLAVNPEEGTDPESLTLENTWEDVGRRMMMEILDLQWRDHLTNMQGLRDMVGLHGYASKDPKYVYKREGFRLFDNMRATVYHEVTSRLMRMTVRADQATQPRLPSQPRPLALSPQAAQGQPALMDALRRAAQGQAGGPPPASGALPGGPDTGAQAQAAMVAARAQAALAQVAARAVVQRSLPKLGRNDPCWCGSGKKYKKCHMRADYEEAGLPLPGEEGGGSADA